jgi:hypothetical protein
MQLLPKDDATLSLDRNTSSSNHEKQLPSTRDKKEGTRKEEENICDYVCGN